jgi:hypothetical protein
MAETSRYSLDKVWVLSDILTIDMELGLFEKSLGFTEPLAGCGAGEEKPTATRLAGPISNWPSQCQATPNSGRSMLPADRKVGNS